MIAASPNRWPWTALSILTILLLCISCNCHNRPPKATWVDDPGYKVPDSTKFPLKNQVIVWKKPDAKEEEFQQWLIKLKKDRPTVQALAVCAHCDSDMILLYDTSLLPYLQNQTNGGSGGTGSPQPTGEEGPTLYCTNYGLSTHEPHTDTITRRLPSTAMNLTWPKPKTGNPLIVAVFDSGLDSAGTTSIATVPNTCFQVPDGENSHHGWNFSAGNANIHDDMAEKHGTKVTRIIMNQVQNFGGSDVAILPVKIFNSQGQGTLFGMLCGLAYASGAGAKIVNASFGFYHYANIDTTMSVQIEKLYSAFLNKYLTGTGMLMVAAAGNDDPAEDSVFHQLTHSDLYRYLDSNQFYPACFSKDYPNVITVTTVSQQTQKPSPLENASKDLVDVGAQCDAIAPNGAYVFYDPIMPPVNTGHGYIVYTVTGSSFAAPVVTGRIAALYSTLTNKTDKHVIIPALNTTANGRTVLTIDKALADSIRNGELAP